GPPDAAVATAEPVMTGPSGAGREPPPIQAAVIPDTDYGAALAPLKQLGVPIAHALGFTGRGIRIALLDTGFKRDHESLASLTVVASRDFVNGDTIVSDEPLDPSGTENHGTGVWSLLAAYRPGTLIGPAFEAEFALAKIALPGAREDEALWVQALEWAVDAVRAGVGASARGFRCFSDGPAFEAEFALAKIALPGAREDEALWVQALEWAVDSVGADVVVSSLGFRFFSDGSSYDVLDLDGNTAVSTLAADEAARRGVLVV